MKKTIKSTGRRWMAAAALVLVLTLLFSGCTNDPARPAESTGGTTAAPTEAAQTQAVTTTEAVSLPAPDFDKTCWDASFGQSLGSYYCLQFQPDGTFRHFHFSTKTPGDTGRYSFDGSILKLQFQSGEDSFDCDFRWDGKGFISVEEQEMPVGKGYYTIALDPEASMYFDTESTEPVWNLSLDKTDISFFGAGEGYTLIVRGVAAGTEILWTTEDEAIASVDGNGRVTAVGPGTTKVLAQIGEEKLVCWVRCQFTAPTGEEAPALNKTDITFFGIGESFLLSVSNVPEGESVVWSSEDVRVASVDERGRVTAVGPGTIRAMAQVGDVTLYCWVRCQFAAPPAPRCSVPDGSWLVTLYRDRLTPIDNSSDGGIIAEGDLLDHVTVSKTELDRLEEGSALDLTAFGKRVYRVREAAYNETEARYEIKADGGLEMVFAKDDSGRWCLTDANGEFELWASGSVKLVFNKNTVLLDQMSAVLSGAQDPVRISRLEDYFQRQPGYETSLPVVGVSVENGVVTQSTWYYTP